jgi:hypothetical protein
MDAPPGCFQRAPNGGRSGEGVVRHARLDAQPRDDAREKREEFRLVADVAHRQRRWLIDAIGWDANHFVLDTLGVVP